MSIIKETRCKPTQPSSISHDYHTNRHCSVALGIGGRDHRRQGPLVRFTVRIPPLRERREDIPDLVEYLLAKQSQSLKKHFTGVTHEAMQILMTCPWKGNVRELDNALQQAAILGDGPLVTPMDLPPDLRPDADAVGHVENLSEAVRQFEKRHITKMLHRTTDKKEAAERLGVALSSLYRKIAELGI